jgi:hypothetical protein
MGEDVSYGNAVSNRASSTTSAGRWAGRLCALVLGMFVLATVMAWTLYYFLDDLANGHLDRRGAIAAGLFTSMLALIYVGVPTTGVVVVLVQFLRELPMSAFSSLAAVGLLLPLLMLLALASYVPLHELLTQAAAQAVTCMFLIYQVSLNPRSG